MIITDINNLAMVRGSTGEDPKPYDAADVPRGKRVFADYTILITVG